MPRTDWTFVVGIVGNDDEDIQNKVEVLGYVIMSHNFVTDTLAYEDKDEDGEEDDD